MPLSLIFYLTPQTDLPREHLGRQAQGWFLDQVSSVDPDLAEELHNAPGPRPYTLSGLIPANTNGSRSGRWHKGGSQQCLRLTVLDTRLEEFVIKRLLPAMPSALKLWWVELKIEGCTLDPREHAWAGQTSYADLMQAADSVHQTRQAMLQYASPTAFRTGSADIPLPIPGSVFRSYYEKWNAFAPQPLQIDELWVGFAQNCIKVMRLENLNTCRWRFADGARGGATGFTGQVGYNLLPQKQVGEWAPFWEGADRVLQTLSAFSFYCGTGHHTTIGLGQTRPLAESNGKQL
jgi:CRISPR-associated endoribonuclease Cas6